MSDIAAQLALTALRGSLTLSTSLAPALPKPTSSQAVRQSSVSPVELGGGAAGAGPGGHEAPCAIAPPGVGHKGPSSAAQPYGFLPLRRTHNTLCHSRLQAEFPSHPAQKARHCGCARHGAGRLTEEKTMAEKTATPATRNRAWGFYGTCVTLGHADPDAAWNEAIEILTDLAGTFRLEPEVARDLLDAPWGRHLADAYFGNDGMAEAIAELATSRRWVRSTLQITRAIVAARADEGQ
jgi:hypothetical protein